MDTPLNQDPVFAVMMARFLLLPLLCSCGTSTKDTGLGETGIPPDDTESMDWDGDGFGANQDCNDGNAAVNPAAAEICDGIDNDCDGRVDEDDAVDPATWHPDADADGYGAADGAMESCVAPDGHIADGTDCDDSDATLNQDDADADGYSSCEGDCDDANAAFHPGASSDGPLSDYDCDGVISADSLAHAEYSFVGENIGDNAANAVSSAGDVDGDGLDDLWVGARLNDYGGSSAGKAYLVLGASLGTSSTLDLSLADNSIVGESSGDGAGGTFPAQGTWTAMASMTCLWARGPTTMAALLLASPIWFWARTSVFPRTSTCPMSSTALWAKQPWTVRAASPARGT